MATIIPGFIYSLFAALLVGVIVVCACSVVATNIKSDAEEQQLINIQQYIAAQSLTLIAHTTNDNQNTIQYLDIPSQIGNKIFWIQIANDSSSAWVESAFGTTVASSGMRVEIPANVVASGSFISGSGRAILQCQFENQVATLTLTQE